jgi:hypothetical protein
MRMEFRIQPKKRGVNHHRHPRARYAVAARSAGSSTRRCRLQRAARLGSVRGKFEIARRTHRAPLGARRALTGSHPTSASGPSLRSGTKPRRLRYGLRTGPPSRLNRSPHPFYRGGAPQGHLSSPGLEPLTQPHAPNEILSSSPPGCGDPETVEKTKTAAVAAEFISAPPKFKDRSCAACPRHSLFFRER